MGGITSMTYDYLTINFTSVAGFIFMLIFLYANASLERRVKRIFYITLLLEFVEAVTYSVELWTTTFEVLSPLRLWLSAIGYAVRPVIFCLMLMLAMRNTSREKFPKIFYVPCVVNAIGAFSVFFTDIVYSYTADNQFQRGPLGYITYVAVILYLIILMIVVVQSHANRSKLEVMIVFAVCMLLFFSMAVEAIFFIRTTGRTSIIMATIFYYMFFQTQIHNASISKEQSIRIQLEHANKIDGSTGVLNKKAFNDAVEQLLSSQHGQSHSSIGFAFLDLDHLKEINDTLGHAAGDIAISDAANTIQSLCRKSDLIGRFGGDEFYVLLPDIPKQRFLVYLNEAQAKLQKEYSLGEKTVATSASIGAVYTENLENLSYEQLVRAADEALYEAKAAGRNCHVVKEL
jgi:diguanylate cyclase (GGDEF)-like protein